MQEESQEEQHVLARTERELTAGEHFEDGRVVGSSRPIVKVDNGGEHQDGAGHRIEKEFYSGVNAALVTPDSDQEVHRHQADFPEHEKQEQIHRQEYADQTEFQQQQERVYALTRRSMCFRDKYRQGVKGGKQRQYAQAIRRGESVYPPPESNGIGFNGNAYKQSERGNESPATEPARLRPTFRSQQDHAPRPVAQRRPQTSSDHPMSRP
jgi:hypothetical protein